MFYTVLTLAKHPARIAGPKEFNDFRITRGEVVGNFSNIHVSWPVSSFPLVALVALVALVVFFTHLKLLACDSTTSILFQNNVFFYMITTTYYMYPTSMLFKKSKLFHPTSSINLIFSLYLPLSTSYPPFDLLSL